MSIVQALLTRLCVRGWSAIVNQDRRPTRRFTGISLCPRFVWFTHVCQSKSGSRRVPVATNPIEEGHANGRTFTEDRNTVCRRWNRFASCGGFSRMYPTTPPIRFWLNMPRLIHSLMLSHRWGIGEFEFMKGVRGSFRVLFHPSSLIRI